MPMLAIGIGLFKPVIPGTGGKARIVGGGVGDAAGYGLNE
jgi:hypothetical protein